MFNNSIVFVVYKNSQQKHVDGWSRHSTLYWFLFKFIYFFDNLSFIKGYMTSKYMKCPSCYRKLQVSDSREKENGIIVKRRRRCNYCKQIWITLEKIQTSSNNSSLIHLHKINSTPNEIYNEILRLFTSLGQSMNLCK